MQTKGISDIALTQGFSEAYLFDASFAQDAPSDVQTLLLLLMPYHTWAQAPEGCMQISPYYFTAQKAHIAAKETVRLANSAGINSQLNSEIRLKPLLKQLTPFAEGRNTLDFHKKYGSRFHLQLICLKDHDPMKDGLRRQGEINSMCGHCNKCVENCPTGAITPEGFLREKCLRHHMMSGKPIPPAYRSLMGNRLIGCDICQEVCPHNMVLQNEQKYDLPELRISSLLPPDNYIVNIVSEAIGKNEANPNRLCAQACIAAGNSADTNYLHQLLPLRVHPSKTVAEHAAWAVKKLTNDTPQPTS